MKYHVKDLKLAEQGKLRLDDPVEKHLPWFRIQQANPGSGPVTIQGLQVAAFDHMQPKGVIQVQWSDVVLYAAGQINGNQLGSRILRLTP